LVYSLLAEFGFAPSRLTTNGSGGDGNYVRAPGSIMRQFAFFCSNSVNRCRRVRNSRCIWVVAVPTKKKHIGKNAKNIGRHQPESGEPTDANRAMSEIKAQNAAGIQ